MRKFIIAGFTLFALTLAACGSSSTPAAVPTDTPVPPTATTAAPTATSAPAGPVGGTIMLGVGRFVTTTATIKAGQAVKFDDTNGGPHNLLTGTNGTLTPATGAPSELSGSGLPFHGGDSQTVTFPTAGTFMITCTFHPSMEATITVTP
jgi:plastocyanin